MDKIKISPGETVVDPQKFQASMEADLEVAREQLKNPRIQVGSKEAILRRIEIFKEKLEPYNWPLMTASNM